jgi:hypothetical protein
MKPGHGSPAEGERDDRRRHLSIGRRVTPRPWIDRDDEAHTPAIDDSEGEPSAPRQ